MSEQEPTATAGPSEDAEAEGRSVEDLSVPPAEGEASETPSEAVAEPAQAPETPSEPVAEPTAATEEPAEPVAEEPADPVPAVPTPRPRPVPRPPVPGPRSRKVSPAAVAPTTVPALAPPDLSEAELAQAAEFGRVGDDGTVWVREQAGEREVGQYPGADPADAVAFYVRRYADLNAKVLLFEARLTATDLSIKEVDATLEHLATELEAPAAVGDLDALRARLDSLRPIAVERRAVIEAERAAAKQVALEARTAIVEAAEKITATDPARMQWRPAGEKLRALLDEWKEAQRSGPRVDKTKEDELWKRFSHARSTFDRERRRYFADLEKQNSAAKEEKERLVAEAEALASSTEWGAVSAAYRDLMTHWKAAGRASRKDDDALWARFRAAQDSFFAARQADQKATDEEFSANLQAKLALLEQAEGLVPVRDIGAARATLRDILERWERSGKVPRGDMQQVEGRLRAVEQAVRDAERDQWQRSNPETRARAEGAAAQLNAAIEGLERDLADARAAGNARKIAELEEALTARRAWLEQVERAASESRG